MHHGLVQWFEQWFKIKIQLHISERVIYFREKEIWWIAVGANVGHEQNGKNERYERPVVILKKFNKDMFWGVPLTSKKRQGIYYFDLTPAGISSYALVSQLRLMSSKRLMRKVTIVPRELFLQLKECVKAIV